MLYAMLVAVVMVAGACGDACPEDEPGGGVLCVVARDAGVDAADAGDGGED